MVRGYGGVLSSWEEEGGSVVLMGVLVMRFVDVKDLGKALSDTEHCLVYVNFSLMVGNELCLYKTAIIVLIYSPCHKILAISMVWITRTNVTSLLYTSCQKIARGHRLWSVHSATAKAAQRGRPE